MKRTIALILVSFILLASCSKSGIRGKISNNVYQNSFIGLGFNLPEGWSFYTDKQLKDLSASAESENIVYDMRVYNSENINSVGVNIENVGIEYNTSTDVKTYLLNTMSGIDTSLSSIGYEGVTCDLTTIKIGKTEYPAMKISASISSMVLNQLVFCIQKEEYMINIAATSFGEDKTAELVSYFYLV